MASVSSTAPIIYIIALVSHSHASYDLDCEYFVDLKWRTGPYSTASHNGIVPLNKCISSYHLNDQEFDSKIYSCNQEQTNITIDEYQGPNCQGSINASYIASSVEEFNCNGGECPLYSIQRSLRLTNSNSTCPDENSISSTAISYNMINVCIDASDDGYPYNSWISSCNQQDSTPNVLFYSTNDCTDDEIYETQISIGDCINYADRGYPGACNCVDWVNCDGTDNNQNGDDLTDKPTIDPTNNPTFDPTRTRNPSSDPTNAPTDDPTEVTYDPTGQPTDNPIIDPRDLSNGYMNGCMFGIVLMIILFIFA